MRPGWWRYTLAQRLGALAAAALILWTVVTAVGASIATDRMAESIRAERTTRARAIARRVEAALERDLRQLDLIAAASATDPGSLEGLVTRVGLAESVLRVDAAGRVRWTRRVADGRDAAPLFDAIPDFSPDRRHVEETRVIPTRRGSRAFLVLTARESDPIGGLVLAAIDPRTTPLRALVAAYADEPYRVAIVDDAGGDIASSRAGAREIAGGVIEALAPVAHGEWRVRVDQPRDAALASVLTLRRVLVGSALVLLPFAVLVAVAAAQSIRRPVLAMTTAAERLAGGEYTTPVAPAGQDEIGRLSVALEHLRRALQADERRALLLKRVLSAQEEERRRIARELHDETTQQVSALALELDAIGASRPDVNAALGPARAIAHSAIDNLHRVIHDLRPSMLDDLGLLPAIRSFADTHLPPLGITVHCEFPPSLPPLPAEATTAVYRVAQEALTNIARHAHAETVLIGCTVSPAGIVLEIEDDGVGFEPLQVTRPKATGEGLGLLGMRERLALLGGTLAVESEPGHGTRVVATLPLADAQIAA